MTRQSTERTFMTSSALHQFARLGRAERLGREGRAAAFASLGHQREIGGLLAVPLRALFTPHHRDAAAVVLAPFWHRPSAGSVGVLAGKLDAHRAHHRFGHLGHLRHIQLNVRRVGVKGSGRNVRVPLVRLSNVPHLVGWVLESMSRRGMRSLTRLTSKPSVQEVV